jgi:hypothetical protein
MKCLRLCLAALLTAASVPVFAADEQPAAPEMTPEQKAMMEAWQRASEVRAEHRQLAAFAGNWNSRVSMWEAEGQPPTESAGKETTAVIYDGRYVESVYEGSFMGAPFTGRSFMGYDNLAGKYFVTWIDSMSTGFWIAYGDYDAASKRYEFIGDMHDMMAPATKLKVRTTVTVESPDAYTFDWYETRDGKERKTMSIAYTRAK